MVYESHEAIFSAFRISVENIAKPYFKNLGFTDELPFNIENKCISKRFAKGINEVRISISLTHLDYADGIEVQFKSQYGVKHLLTEVKRSSAVEVSPYLFWVHIVDEQMCRIVVDFRKYLAKYVSI